MSIEELATDLIMVHDAAGTIDLDALLDAWMQLPRAKRPAAMRRALACADSAYARLTPTSLLSVADVAAQMICHPYAEEGA